VFKTETDPTMQKDKFKRNQDLNGRSEIFKLLEEIIGKIVEDTA
jgi:hypothetical protein